MSGFQVSIVSMAPIPEDAPAKTERFGIEKHGKGIGKVVERIDALEKIWDQVVEKLTGIAEKSRTAATNSKFEMNSIEFNIGIEAGLNVGLVTKGEASIAITFERKPAEKKDSQ